MTQNLERADARPDRGDEPARKLEPVAAAGRSWQRMLVNPWVVSLAVIVVFNLLYALPRYLTFDPAESRIPLDANFPLQFPVLVAHVLTGNIALVTLFLQVLPALRGRNKAVHKVSGYVYLYAGVLPGALLALVLLPFSTAPTGSVGLGAMAVGWIVVTLVGFSKQRRHQYRDHRRWMYYSFALALGTSWGRVLGIVFPLLHIQMNIMVFLELTSWLWVANVIVAQWLWERRYARRRTPSTREWPATF